MFIKEKLLLPIVLACILPIVHFLLVKVVHDSEFADIFIYTIFLFFIAHAIFIKSFPLFEESDCEKSNNVFDNFALQTLFIVTILSASIITVFPGAEKIYWFGYGEKVIFFSIFALPLVIFLIISNSKNLNRFGAIISYIGLSIFYIPSIIQPPWGMIDIGHSIYILNELMSPATGNFPIINFTTQYTSLLGYIFRIFFGQYAGVEQAVWFISGLSILNVALILYPLMKFYPNGKAYLAILFTVPAIFIVKQNEDSYSGTIAALFSALPIRLLFPALMVFLISSIFFKSDKFLKYFFLGIISGIAVLNNVESGLVATIAALMVIYISNQRNIDKKFIICVIGFILTLIIYFSFNFLIFGNIKISWFFAFASGFGKGFGAVSMPSFGLWVFVFTFLYISVCTSVSQILITKFINLNYNISVITLFWSLFGVGMLPYYINRSVVSGQLQFILIPLFISCAGLFAIVYKSNGFKSIIFIKLLIVSIPPAISIASIIQLPSLSLASNRLFSNDNYFLKNYDQMINNLNITKDAINNSYKYKNIGLFMNFGSIFSKRIELKSYLPVNNYSDLQILSVLIIPSTCLRLDNDQIDFLIVGVEINNIAIDFLNNCNFFPINITSVPNNLLVFKRF